MISADVQHHMSDLHTLVAVAQVLEYATLHSVLDYGLLYMQVEQEASITQLGAELDSLKAEVSATAARYT